MICETVAMVASPPIRVLSKTPVVQNVSSVFGDILEKKRYQNKSHYIYNQKHNNITKYLP